MFGGHLVVACEGLASPCIAVSDEYHISSGPLVQNICAGGSASSRGNVVDNERVVLHSQPGAFHGVCNRFQLVNKQC